MNTNFEDAQMIGHTLFTTKGEDFKWLSFLSYYKNKLDSIPKRNVEDKLAFTHLVIHILDELDYQCSVKSVLTEQMMSLLDYFIKEGINTMTCIRLKHLFYYPEDERKYLSCDPIEDDNITILIPLRVDSKERAANVDALLAMLDQMEKVSVIILEADTILRYKVNEKYKRVKHYFCEDENPIFYRTKYINWLLYLCPTQIAGVWDSDAIVSPDQIIEAAQKIQSGEAVISFPFNGFFYGLSPEQSNRARAVLSYDSIQEDISNYKLMHGRGSVGGAYLVNRNKYLLLGGENEHFYGWGPEDAERVKRVNIFGYKVCTCTKPLFHLFHPRKENSRFFDKEREMQNRRAYIGICELNPEELKEYVDYWDSTFKEDIDFNTQLNSRRNECSLYLSQR